MYRPSLTRDRPRKPEKPSARSHTQKHLQERAKAHTRRWIRSWVRRWSIRRSKRLRKDIARSRAGLSLCHRSILAWSVCCNLPTVGSTQKILWGLALYVPISRWLPRLLEHSTFSRRRTKIKRSISQKAHEHHHSTQHGWTTLRLLRLETAFISDHPFWSDLGRQSQPSKAMTYESRKCSSGT